jgi:hypothetical protein
MYKISVTEQISSLQFLKGKRLSAYMCHLHVYKYMNTYENFYIIGGYIYHMHVI